MKIIKNDRNALSNLSKLRFLNLFVNKTRKIVKYLTNKYGSKKKVIFELELSGLMAIYKIDGILKFINKLSSYQFLISSRLIYLLIKKSISQFSNKFIMSKIEVWKFKKFIRKNNCNFNFKIK